MREIVPGLVWIGNARDANDVAGVLDREISAVVHLALEELSSQFPREIIYCRFPLLDGAENAKSTLKIAVLTVSELIRGQVPTLVACSGGMSRSPAVAAVALARANNASPDEWLTRIAEMGPHDVSPALWNELRHCAEAT